MNRDELVTTEELLKELDKYNHPELHVHHTWKPTHRSFNGKNYLTIQNGMRKHHMNTNGWGDIAQHVTLFPDGKWMIGRDFSRQPISIKGVNTVNGRFPFMVEMVGNFDTPGTGEFNNLGYDKLEGEQLKAIILLARYFDEKKRYVRFHNENSTKTCPGTSVDKVDFMSIVRSDKYMDKNKELYHDIKGHWAEEFIRKVIKDGKMSGYPDGTFKPNAPLTRAEFATFIAQNMK